MSELIVELLCEELPVAMIRPALAALRNGVLGLLEGIDHGEARTYATPRRLAVVVGEVATVRLPRPLSHYAPLIVDLRQHHGIADDILLWVGFFHYNRLPLL